MPKKPVFDWPTIVPAPGAEALHADHLTRADKIARQRAKKTTDPKDTALKKARPDVVRFLREAAAAGRVTRFYAGDTPETVRIWLAGPDGVFDPVDAGTRTVTEIEVLADGIATGEAWATIVAIHADILADLAVAA